jgi:hypothetical protein
LNSKIIMTHQSKSKYVAVVLLLIVFASSSTFVEGLDKKERTLPREFFNFSGQNRNSAQSIMDTTERRTSVKSCLRNCDICESFYDKFFRNYLCYRSCIDFDGRIEVDCLNMLSIAPFLDSRTLEKITSRNV